MRATFACMRPMGPAPMTSTVSPGDDGDPLEGVVDAGERLHQRGGHEVRARRGSGRGCPGAPPPRGTFMYGANPPGMLMPNALKVAHIWVLPLTHMSQTPQPMLGATATAMPFVVAGDAGAHLLHDAAHLVPEHERVLGARAAGAVSEHADVGAADRRGLHAQQHLPRPDDGDRDRPPPADPLCRTDAQLASSLLFSLRRAPARAPRSSGCRRSPPPPPSCHRCRAPAAPGPSRMQSMKSWSSS